MKKALKITAIAAIATTVIFAFSSCKSSKSADGGVMYNRKARKNSQTIKANYRVVGENTLEVIPTCSDDPVI